MQILAARGALPENRYSQQEITDSFAGFIAHGGLDERVLRRLHANAGVAHRNLALPLDAYAGLEDFTSANDAFIAEAVRLGSRALEDALKAADLTPSDVDLVVCATVTGLAVPSLEARIALATGLRPDVKRVPLVGLGCVAGAAGTARLHDHLAGHPHDIAVLIAVELCSLTVQRDDVSMPNLVASGLFGDGACAVVARGAASDLGRADPGEPTSSRAGTASPAAAPRGAADPAAAVRTLATRSRLYPDTERTMGFDVTSGGLRIVLDAEVPTVVRRYVREDVDAFLADHGLDRSDVGWWVCHPGGPKVIEALQDALEVPPEALRLTWESLARVGNLSSASVLHVLEDTLRERPPPPGSHGVMLAMGPGFCSELVLLRAEAEDRPQEAAGQDVARC